MKRFALCVFLAFCLLISACSGIESPDAEPSSADASSNSSAAESDVSESADSSVESSSAETAESSGSNETSECSVPESSADVTVDVSVPEPPVSEEDSSAADVSASVNSEAGDDTAYLANGILITGTRGMEQYFGSPESGASCSKMIGDFKNDLGDGVEVYTAVAPHTSCYYAPSSYSNLIERGRMNFANLKEKCAPNVHYVDVYNALWEHVDEPIYHRTELHWAALAGYYAAEAFAKEANVSFPPLDSYKKIVKQGYVGSAYTFSKADVIKNNPEDFVIYMPQTECTAYYYNEGNYDLSSPNFERDNIVFDTMGYAGAFICGDSYTVKVVTKNNTGRKLVIFKDSYGNAFAPFTLASFDEIYIVDIRYYKRNGVKLCKEVGATDAVFAISANTATGVVYKHIEELRTAP